ncbi:MAG: hypothetical protein LBE57_06165 [Methanosarcinales archaeon]|jgi:hypothetical protein|nr:hypothetical protein [Methanosarcinales archaeon]
MKKQLLLIGLCLVLVAVLAAGCLGGGDNNTTNNTTNNTPFVPPDRIEPPVGDIAMYRGNVTNISTVNGTTTITLAQVRGTNFGAPNMTFVVDNNSRLNFNVSDLRQGQYVEVFYGSSNNSTEPRTIIVANLLQYANMTVYNGAIVTVTSVTPPPNGTTVAGQLEIRLENNSLMIFNYDDSTQFYMNMSDLTAGTEVNIFAGWIITASEPPQVFAYEVRPFYTLER